MNTSKSYYKLYKKSKEEYLYFQNGGVNFELALFITTNLSTFTYLTATVTNPLTFIVCVLDPKYQEFMFKFFKIVLKEQKKILAAKLQKYPITVDTPLEVVRAMLRDIMVFFLTSLLTEKPEKNPPGVKSAPKKTITSSPLKQNQQKMLDFFKPLIGTIADQGVNKLTDEQLRKMIGLYQMLNDFVSSK